MSGPDKSPELEKQNAPFSLVDLDALKRETVVQRARGCLKTMMVGVIGFGTLAAVPGIASYVGCQEERERAARDQQAAVWAQEFDEEQERALESFGSQGEVVQILGKNDFISGYRRYEAWQCVVKNSEGIKLVVSFDIDLPVVVGETWEMEYLADKNIYILSQQVEKQKEL